jgi:hypothetical protein
VGLALAYSIHWRSDGAVKYFTGDVSFDDIIKSESEITGSSRYTSLKYVISMFVNTRHLGLTESQRMEIRALRLGGYYSNQRIKYAFVTEDASVTHAIEQSVIDGLTLHETKVFRAYEDAVAWVGS